MTRSSLVVPWERGIHARPASRVVKLASSFASSVSLSANGQVANAKSMLSILLLCAAMGTVIEVEAHGDDENRAVRAITELFNQPD